jgi:hypothetical protein
MNARKASVAVASALLIASLFGVRSASAFCQATTCDPTKADCKPNAAGCFTVGAPLSWVSDCVTVSVQADGSASQQIDYDAAEASVGRAFAAWTNAGCTGGKPSISVRVEGPISCDASEYNSDRGNANIVVFRDSWPYVGGEDALGLTRLRFNPDTGEIYDSDIEVNTVTEPLSVGEPKASAVDLDSLLTHEAGHLLGLAHTLEVGATMLAGYKLGSIELRSLAPDDVAGLCGIYPPKRQLSSTSCEPRHGYSDLCGADQPAKPPETTPKSEPAASSCSFSLRGTNSVGAFALSLLLAFGLRRKRRFVAASLTGAALAGCSLDTRQLQLGREAGGQPSAGSPSIPGTGEQGGTAGQDAGAPTMPAMIDGCIDLDEDGISDCDETLVQNATFNTDVDAWHADGSAELTWDERNAADDLPSGSAQLDATGTAASGAEGSATQSASQCSKVTGKHLITVYANTFVDSDRLGLARIDVHFFDTHACTGDYTTTFSTPQPLDAASGKWLALKAGSVSGVDTKSVRVRLVVSRPLSEASVQARFDNVLLKATEIE